MKQKIAKLVALKLGEGVLESPKDKNLAHFASPLAFSLAKKERKSPVLIAKDLASKFEEEKEFFSVQAVNGYINFKLTPSFLNTLANEALNDPKAFAKGCAKEESILLEYVSANPTGPLHIGHARGAVYGDSLSRIARHLGYRFDTEYYINDAGKQIELLGLSLLLIIKENAGLKVEYPESFYRGEYLDKLALKAVKTFGDLKDEDIHKLALWAKDEIMLIIKEDLKAANINIQSYVSESSFNIEEVLLKLGKNSYEKDGKIYLASSLYKDEKDRVIVREDGRPTYLAADIAYHADKLSRGYTHCINIWGADHHGYINRMRSALHFLGFDESRLEIILAQMVALLKDGKPYKMSKRAGNSVLMSDILNEIGKDALRFMFLSKKCDTHLEFDLKTLAAKDASNPVFYINYAHARTHQVFIKAAKETKDVLEADFNDLGDDAQNLAFLALNLKACLDDAFKTRQLQKVCDYLLSLASAFHKFYNEHKVLGSPNEDAFLKLFALVALSLKTGLSVIGIKAADKV